MLLLFPSILLLSSFLPFSYSAPAFTAVDASGNVVLASYQTNAAGSTTATVIVSTISLAAVAGVAPAAAATPAVVGYNPACTTAGCKAAPTTYSQETYINGVLTTVIMTFIPTTPPTPIPTWSSSGSILGISQYITTTFTATLFTTITTGAGARDAVNSLTGGSIWSLAVLIGGLVGALFVL